jgi:ribose transport system substrate-binding protein
MLSTRSFAALAVGLIAVGTLAGCDSSSTTASGSASGEASAAATRPAPTGVPEACTPEGGGTLQLGMVDINEQTAFFTQMNQGAQDVADAAGAELQIVSGDNDSATQVTAVENLVASGVDALIVDPVDATALVPALTAAKAAGIPVVAADGSVDDPSAIDAYVGTANVDGGAQLGEAFLELTGGEGEVGIVGALSSAIQIQRQDGFIDAVEAGGMTIGTIVDGRRLGVLVDVAPVDDGRNVNEDAQTAAENLLTGNPDLEYIYATGEPALNGTIAAVKSQGAQDRVSIVGWDLSASAVEGLEAGFVDSVIQQDTFGFGNEAAKAAIDLACGTGDVPSTIDVPITIVTPDNLADFSYYLEG